MEEKNKLLSPLSELAMLETMAFSGDEENDEYAQVLSECKQLIREICELKGFDSEQCLKEFETKVEYAKCVDSLTIDNAYTKEQIAEIMDAIFIISNKKDKASDVIPLFDIGYRLIEEMDVKFMRL